MSADATEHPKADVRPVFEFTDRQIRLISQSLPAETDPERRQQLEETLRDWGKRNVPIFLLYLELRLETKHRRKATAVAKHSAALAKAIAVLDPVTRKRIGMMLAKPDGERRSWWWLNEEVISTGLRRFHQFFDSLTELHHAAVDVAEGGAIQEVKGGEEAKEGGVTNRRRKMAGRHREIMSTFLLNDLSDMCELATGLKATRRVDREAPEGGPYDVGPFYEFSAAIWPVVFRNGDAGLSAALKNWAMAFPNGGTELAREFGPAFMADAFPERRARVYRPKQGQ
ncbi:MAG TPA: hypothetical protein VKQ73_16690 [Stellaceae bacterium]|nr:hypothetical protein [Stellaceae bacterium]